MARDENPPFPRGELGTAYDDPSTASSTGNSQLEGMEWEFEDLSYAAYGVPTNRGGGRVRCRVVRNKAATALLPKRAIKAKLDATGGFTIPGQTDGYAETVGDHLVLGVVDEFLPSAGVPVNGLFWCVVGGVSKWTTAAAGDTNFAAGKQLIPSTDGKAIEQDVTVAAGAATFNQVQGVVGTALEAVNGTDTDFLVYVAPRRLAY